MGRLDTTIKKPTPVSSVAGGRLQKKVQPAVQPSPVQKQQSNPYFYAKTDPKGGAIGYSQDEFDSSGKPFFAYRNPGDTATTTDKRRVATTFDPRVATTTPSESFYNKREDGLRDKVSGRLGTKSNEQVDHITSLALSGSNSDENLRNWSASKNLKSAPKVYDLQQDVSSGRLPLFDAQVKEAKSKSGIFNRVPEPWTPAKEGILKKVGNFIGDLLPGVKKGVEAIKNKDLGVYTDWYKGYTKDLVSDPITFAGSFTGGGGKGKAFSTFHIDDKKFLTEVIEKLKLKKTVSPRDLEVARETLTTYGYTPPKSQSGIRTMIEKEKGAVDKATDAIAERELSSQMDRNVRSPGNEDIANQYKKGRLQPRDTVGRYGTVEKPKTIDGELMSSGRLGQKAKTTTMSSNAATVNNISERIIPESIPQKKGVLGRLVDKYKSSPLSSQKGSVGGRMEKRFSNNVDPDLAAKKASQTEDLVAKAEAARNARVAQEAKPLKISAEGRPLALNARERAIVSASREAVPPFAPKAKSAPVREAGADLGGSKDNGRVPSFDSIIEKIPTPVKEKVNIIDYVRTPEKVLKKIGLENEAKAIRKSYEGYAKELPKNIDKVTEWSKQVSPEGNQRIFQFLDGKDVPIAPNEAKVAGEVKAWLKEWADRLGLPEDKRISHYITHIFDKELIAKEFDEDLAKIIADKIPGEVYDPFLLERLGAKGYKQDTWAALDAYVKRATRKVHMDPALNEIKAKSGQLELSQFNYVKRYVDNINMRPTELDTVLDNGIKSIIGYKYGQRPVTALTKTLRQLTFRGMLGLNPGSALRNISQGINTYSTLGEKYTIVGYSNLLKKGAMQELKDVGVLADSFIQDRVLTSTRKNIERMDKVLFAMFDTAEKINRGSAYFGAKAKALSKGKSMEEAIEYGKEVVRKTQFNFSSIDTPVSLQNDLAKTLLQFQTYTVKQVEFMSEMVKDKNVLGLLRYAVGGLAFTYTIGKSFGMEPEQIMPMFRFDTPPSLKFPVEATKAALNTPDKYGNTRTLNEKATDVGKSAVGLVPAGNQIKKSYEGVKSIQEGGSYDRSGKLQFKQDQSTGGRLQSALFGKYAGEEAKNYFNKEPSTGQTSYDKVQKLILDGKKQEAQAIVDAMTDVEYSEYKKAKTVGKRKETLASQKDIMPKVVKIESLIAKGKRSEAQAIVDSMTDEEYKAYKLAKNK